MINIIENKDIEYSIGDTFSLPVRAQNDVVFTSGMVLRFIISESEQSDTLVDEKFAINDDLTFTVSLSESNKRALQLGRYFYKMIIYGNNKITTEKSGYFTVKWGE